MQYSVHLMRDRRIGLAVIPLLAALLTSVCIAEPLPPSIICDDNCTSYPSNLSATYDLSAFNIPFVEEFNWPVEPSTTRTINVAAGDSAGFLSAVSRPGSIVIVPAGTYYGTPNIASDVDILLADDAIIVLSGTLATANDRFRWTGGVIDGGGSAGYDNSASDVMWNNVRFDNMSDILPGLGSPVSRVAIINSTIETNAAVFFTQGGGSSLLYSDFILAGCDIYSGPGGFASRMQRIERVIQVDNRFQAEGFHSLRLHYASTNVYWGNNTMIAGSLINVARNGSGPGSSDENLGNLWVIGNTTYNSADPQTGFNRLAFSGEGPQVWQNNVAYVAGISQTFVDESIRWPAPTNPGDITSNNTRSPYGSGPPTNFSDWVNDFSNGADH